MENLKQELESIQKIADELSKVEEARRAHVLDFVINSLNIKKVKTSNEDGSINTSSCISESKPENAMTLPEFIQNKKPKNNYQLIACLGYYLEQIKGVKEFGAKEIRESNAEARLPPISNITRDIQNTQRQYNFIIPSTKNQTKKTLSNFGLDLVKALPNQEEAKLIMSNARPKLKKKNSKDGDDEKE